MLTTSIDPRKLRAALSRKGISVVELAQRVGVSRATIYSYLQGVRGKRPSFRTVMALARALDLEDPSEILAFSLPSFVTSEGNFIEEKQEGNDALASH